MWFKSTEGVMRTHPEWFVPFLASGLVDLPAPAPVTWTLLLPHLMTQPAYEFIKHNSLVKAVFQIFNTVRTRTQKCAEHQPRSSTSSLWPEGSFSARSSSEIGWSPVHLHPPSAAPGSSWCPSEGQTELQPRTQQHWIPSLSGCRWCSLLIYIQLWTAWVGSGIFSCWTQPAGGIELCF